MDLKTQLATAHKYHAHLKAKNHADAETFAAIVATLEKCLSCEEMTEQMKGNKP